MVRFLFCGNFEAKAPQCLEFRTDPLAPTSPVHDREITSPVHRPQGMKVVATAQIEQQFLRKAGTVAA